MGKNKGIPCAEKQHQKGGAKKPKGVAKRPIKDIRYELDKDSRKQYVTTPSPATPPPATPPLATPPPATATATTATTATATTMPKTPPLWQTFIHGIGLIMLANMLNKCILGISIIDGSNQPPPTKPPTRVTVVVASPNSVVRWAPWFNRPDVFFLMVENPKEEDPAIGDLLQCLRNVKVYVQTGDTKEGEITIGAKFAAINGCHVIFFSKAGNSPNPKNRTVNCFHGSLLYEILAADAYGDIRYAYYNASTPRA